ncbi:MAG TPA: permease [Chthoniobacteraceae bacterium]|nr:permease [Chthoniobacteraceae bacterium]
MSWFSFHFNDFAFSFLSILLEGVPLLLLGSIISGLVDVFVSSERLTRLLPGNSVPAIFLSGLLGLVFPMCECSSVVIIRRFIKKGLPLGPAVTYMLAAPILSPIVALSTFAAFKGRNPASAVHVGATGFAKWVFDHEGSILMTSLRLGIAYIITVAIGLIVLRIPASKLLQPAMTGAAAGGTRTGLRISAAPMPQQEFSAIIESASVWQKLLLAVQSATADFLDVTFLLIIGAGVASVFNTAVDQSIILPYASNPPVAILVMMGLAAALAICSTTDAFIAASFVTFPFESKLAFLLFGPLFNLKLYFLYAIILRRRVVVILGVGLALIIALICWRLAAVHLWG